MLVKGATEVNHDIDKLNQPMIKDIHDGCLVNYRQTSYIRRTKCQYLNVSRFDLQLNLPNPLKPGVKSRMNM